MTQTVSLRTLEERKLTACATNMKRCPQCNRVESDEALVFCRAEQLRGQTADARSDIFSFGTIFYEMLSGRRAFRGNSMAETMSAILKEDPPDLSEINKTVSPALERLVHHCLEKRPEERFHSARDLAFAIEALTGAATNSGQTAMLAKLPAITESSPHRRRLRNVRLWVVSTVVLTLSLLALAFVLLRHRLSVLY